VCSSLCSNVCLLIKFASHDWRNRSSGYRGVDSPSGRPHRNSTVIAASASPGQVAVTAMVPRRAGADAYSPAGSGLSMVTRRGGGDKWTPLWSLSCNSTTLAAAVPLQSCTTSRHGQSMRRSVASAAGVTMDRAPRISRPSKWPSELKSRIRSPFGSDTVSWRVASPGSMRGVNKKYAASTSASYVLSKGGIKRG